MSLGPDANTKNAEATLNEANKAENQAAAGTDVTSAPAGDTVPTDNDVNVPANEGGEGGETTSDIPVIDTASKKSANDQLTQYGLKRIAEMSDEERENLCSESANVQFNHLLGQVSIKSTRKVGDKTIPCPETVGMNVTMKYDTYVPQLDVLKDHETGYAVSDVTYKLIKAGESVDLTRMEAGIMLVQDIYGGHFATKSGDPKGLRYTPKVSKYVKNTQKLPTPAFNYASGEGSVKETIVPIDKATADGKGYEILPQYAEKFGPLLEKTRAKRNSGPNGTKKQTVAAATALAKAVQGLYAAPPMPRAPRPAPAAEATPAGAGAAAPKAGKGKTDK